MWEGLELRVSTLGFRVSGFCDRFRLQVLGIIWFRVHPRAQRFKVQGFCHRISGLKATRSAVGSNTYFRKGSSKILGGGLQTNVQWFHRQIQTSNYQTLNNKP